jgi:hypothetical protein
VGAPFVPLITTTTSTFVIAPVALSSLAFTLNSVAFSGHKKLRVVMDAAAL